MCLWTALQTHLQILRIGQLSKWQTMWERIWSEKLSRFLFLHFRSILFLSVWISQTCCNVAVFGQSDNRIFFWKNWRKRTQPSLYCNLWLAIFQWSMTVGQPCLCIRLGSYLAFCVRLFYNYFISQRVEIQTFSSQFYLKF